MYFCRHKELIKPLPFVFFVLVLHFQMQLDLFLPFLILSSIRCFDVLCILWCGSALPLQRRIRLGPLEKSILAFVLISFLLIWQISPRFSINCIQDANLVLCPLCKSYTYLFHKIFYEELCYFFVLRLWKNAKHMESDPKECLDHTMLPNMIQEYNVDVCVLTLLKTQIRNSIIVINLIHFQCVG